MAKPAKSLFKKSAREMVPATDANIRAFFDSLRKRNPLAEAAEVMLAAASAAEKNVELERGSDYASEVRLHLKLMQGHLEGGRAEFAAFHAMKAAEYWMMIRTDAVFADHVRARTQYLDKRDDGQRQRAEHILRETGSMTKTALRMDVSDRALRKLLPKPIREQLIRRKAR